MLRKFLDFQLSLSEKGKPLHKLRPLLSAIDTFFYESPIKTEKGPHIRDAIDLKRCMMLVVIALMPCIAMAVWNTGVQAFVYSSKNAALMTEYLSIHSFKAYFDFVFHEGRELSILKEGAKAFFPVMIISYAVGGLWEGIFACLRGHEMSEGFLVTGMLFALILPPTIPYWMVALGVSVGVIIGKELFGGTGMNILNPALVARCFLFFTFPTKMTGDVWVGTNPTLIRDSLTTMNAHQIDGLTQTTALGFLSISPDIKRIHVDAIAAHLSQDVPTWTSIVSRFEKWNTHSSLHFEQLSDQALQDFITAPLAQNGLGLQVENYPAAHHFSLLKYGGENLTDGNFFFGNMLGSMGETSTLACLLGAFFLILTGIGSWRTILGVGLGAFACALLFQWGSHVGIDAGAWNPAKFDLAAYKHLLLGGLAFGMVFMATDPVSSPGMKGAKWVYGAFIGLMTILIRMINPAFSEGVMLAILLGNVSAPLLDHIALEFLKKVRRGRARKAIS